MMRPTSVDMFFSTIMFGPPLLYVTEREGELHTKMECKIKPSLINVGFLRGICEVTT